MIDRTRESIAVAVNSGLTMLYWHIGNRVRKEILNNQRAEYRQEIVSTVSRQFVLRSMSKGLYHCGIFSSSDKR